MSAGRYRKNKRAGTIPPCRQCMHPAKVNPGEAHYSFWLNYAEVDTGDLSPREWVEKNGLPPKLREIAEPLMRAHFLRTQHDLVDETLRAVQ